MKLPTVAAVLLAAALVAQAAELIKAPKGSTGVDSEDLEFHPTRLIVKFKATTKAATAAAAPRVVLLKAGTNVLAAAKAYSKRPDVAYAHPDYKLKSTATPNDPAFSTKGWNLKRVSAPAGWDLTTGSKAITVCVIDSGIDYTHPDIAPNMHELKGFNTITNTMGASVLDDYYHGTHLAGIIGAVGNNGMGIAGVNWAVKLLGCKFMDAKGVGYTSGATACIQKCAAQGARIINTSFSGGTVKNQAMIDAINAASNTLFVSSAGNTAMNLDITPRYPASYKLPNQVVVASTGATDLLSSFSNWGPSTVHLGAPGEGIYSTVPSLKDASHYFTASGTSQAAPLVAGAAALAQAAAGGTLSPAKLKTLLLSSVDPLDSLAGKTSSGGILNVAKFVAAAKATSASPARKLLRDMA